MTWLLVIMIAGSLLLIGRNTILPQFYMREIEKEKLNDEKYHLIDVRDYTTFHRNPFKQAQNIPLSYLSREMKSETSCEKDIVIIADGQKAAKMAARMIKKQFKKPVYYLNI